MRRKKGGERTAEGVGSRQERGEERGGRREPLAKRKKRGERREEGGGSLWPT